MLELILGRAGSGKTNLIYERVNADISEGRPGNILIVPEQFSHDAEREMARVCTDDACLYAEVLSFTRLAGRVFAEVGGLAARLMDKGGRTLAMSRAVTECAPQLRLYSLLSGKADFLSELISGYDELRSAGADVGRLREAAEMADGRLRMKLEDLVLIFESYERIKELSGLDPRDRLELLRAGIGRSSVGAVGHIYVDGFTDFTVQEQNIIKELLKKGADITVTLGTPSLDTEVQAFRLPASTGLALVAAANRLGSDVSINALTAGSSRPAELRFLEEKLMDYSDGAFPEKTGRITVASPSNPAEECVYAAAKAIELVRKGARYRDIAIVSPAWQSYASVSGGIFEKFGLPVNSSDRAEIVNKPVLAFITGALDIVTSDFEWNAVLRYIKTGLADITDEEADLLENYLIKWPLRGMGRWTRGDWKMHPEGYKDSMNEEEAERLRKINAAREKVAAPLWRLARSLAEQETAAGKTIAIYDFMEDSGFYGRLEEKVSSLKSAGKLRLADEYSQLWDILTGALGQLHDIVSDTPMGTEELSSLIKLVFSQYDVATIPSSADAVGVGDMKRMRGRGIKHLIVLGATDTALPSVRDDADIFSEDERLALRNIGIELPDPEDDMLSRELGLIYSSFTMPSETLTLCWPNGARPSYIVTRIMMLFDLSPERPGEELWLAARRPALELAARAGNGGEYPRLARAYFDGAPEAAKALRILDSAAQMPRGRLSHLTAERLFGKQIKVSASKIDKFYSCKFMYFLQYGLKLKPRREAALDAPESGTFIHYILEKVVGEAHDRGGFREVSDEFLKERAEFWSGEYAREHLGGLEDKTGRFRYLFSRLSDDAGRIVLATANELRASDFEPLDFELHFGRGDGLPAPTTANGVRLEGSVDRVDGWVHKGKLYLRVVDYKTGKKSFELSDVYNGLNLQMLIYLFTLEKDGKSYYNHEIVPAGVLYSPARDNIVPVSSNLDGEELEIQRRKENKHSGLYLDDPELLDAMDHTENHVYLNINSKHRENNLATAEKLGALARHVSMLVSAMGDELRNGSIAADPYYRSQQDVACTYCDYFGACHFGANRDESFRNISGLKSPAIWTKLMEEAK